MKKLIISAMVLCAAFAANAAGITPGQLTRVALPEGVVADKATISPDGQFAVIAYGTGLSKVDLASGSVSKVAEVANPYNVSISADGSKVVYTQPTYDKNHLRKVALQSADLATGKVEQITKPSRNLTSGYSLKGNVVNAVNNGKLATKALDGTKAAKDMVVGINYGHLDLTVDGKTTTLDPQGRGSYLWPSISPDGTKIVYWLATQGCFVCDIDGTNVRRIGGVRAAVWADNENIIGMVDTDDDINIVSSYLVAVGLDGKGITLTGSDVVATYPTVSADGSKVAFTTPAGELYTLTLNR